MIYQKHIKAAGARQKVALRASYALGYNRIYEKIYDLARLTISAPLDGSVRTLAPISPYNVRAVSRLVSRRVHTRPIISASLIFK